MNVFNVFFPHLTYILGIILGSLIFIFPISLLGGIISIFFFHRAAKKNINQVEPPTLMGLSKNGMMKMISILFLLMIFVLYTVFFLSFADGWLHIKPSINWENEMKSVDTVIILGFGYEKNNRGEMVAGKSNEFLLDWALKHSNAETVLVQEGVWAAVTNIRDSLPEKPGNSIDKTDETGDSIIGDKQSLERWGRRFFRIHRDNEEVYVNTIQACFCAMQLMGDLNKNKALVIAHDLQLERVAWDFNKLKKSKDNWKSFEFIFPKIPLTPFPENSDQWHTKNRFIYKFVELFLSRVRDFVFPSPQKCISPI